MTRVTGLVAAANENMMVGRMTSAGTGDSFVLTCRVCRTEQIRKAAQTISVNKIDTSMYVNGRVGNRVAIFEA